MIQTSQVETRKQIFKYLSIFLLFLSISILLSTQAYADGPIDIGGGEGVTGGGEYFDGGYGDWAGGYRTYLEDESGSIVQGVWDITFADPNGIGAGYLVQYYSTSLGGKTASLSRRIPYNSIQSYVPGLQPPFLNYNPWGEQLDAWFEGQSTVGGVTTQNAYLFIMGVFSYAGEDWKTYIEEFDAGRYRIVVEALYYYRLVDYNRQSMMAGGNTLAFYGTVRDIAKYYDIPTISKKISEVPYYGGGKWLGQFTNGDFATALQLVETDEFSGFGPPVAKTGNKSDEGGWLTYDDIKEDKQGWGMHVIFKEKVEEKWATYDATAYGGTKGQSPGKTPEMPPMAGTDSSWRQVTVIKYYEEYVMTDQGIQDIQFIRPHQTSTNKNSTNKII